MSGRSSPTGSSWAAAQVEVDGIRLYLCEAQGVDATDVEKPGFIVYDGVPSDEFRDRVRRCLSFALERFP